MSATINTAKAPKTTATVLTPEVLQALGALAADKEALKVFVAQNPELGAVANQLAGAAAEQGSPRNVAATAGLAGDHTILKDWMDIEKGKSSYCGVTAEIADRTFAARFVLPTKKLETGDLKEKLHLLTVKVALFAAQEAKAMGITSI